MVCSSLQRPVIMNFNKWNLFWSVCFGSTACLIIFGNSLSISVFAKRRLRRRAYYLLLDLAVADLLVGLFSIPIYMTTVISEEALVSRMIFDCVDMFTGFSSIFTLAFISLERLHAIVRPFRHRRLSSHCYTIAIVTPWILSLAVTSTRLLFGFSVIEIQHFVVVMIISLSTPLLTYCASYGVIYRKHASRPRGVRAKGEARLSKTLVLITGAFALTWLPFQMLVIVLNICSPCKKVPAVVVFGIKLLQFANSFVNFAIYCLRMQSYRNALYQILGRCKCCLARRREPLYPLTDIPTGIKLVSFSSTLHYYPNSKQKSEQHK